MKIHTIQLHIGDLESGTRHMDATEFGAYMALLIACYQSKDNRLLDDNKRLAQIAKVTPHVWKKIRPTIVEKFTIIEEDLKKFFIHDRVSKDVEKYKILKERNSKNAQERWKNKDSEKNDNMRVALKSHSELVCDRNATQHPIPNTHNNNEVINPPTPQKIIQDLSKNLKGVSKQSFEEEIKVDDIMRVLTDKDMAKARENAKGWDLYQLAMVYAAGINDGTRERPNSIKAAFPIWCAKYTKGKQL